jgi:hypothetical protein
MKAKAIESSIKYFEPKVVQITLETQAELMMLTALVGKTTDDYFHELYDLLLSMGGK